LLNHTSGIANSAANTSCQLNILSNLTASHTLEEAIYCGGSQGELFTPGTNWTYSNTNYSLLAMIIQEVTGMTYSDFISQTIFTPMNMINTEIPITNEITGDHMGCYWNIMGNWTDMTIVDATTYTGWADIVSNTNDLTLFLHSLLNGAIISQTQLDKMMTVSAPANTYGLGMEFSSAMGDAYYGHYGEVGNTSGNLFCELNSTLAPNGYYFAYNYNTQGVALVNKMDLPLYHFMKGDLGLSEIKDVFSVYPNPASTTLIIEGSLELGNIVLLDLTGKVVLSTQNVFDTKLELNISELPQGSYVLKAMSDHAVNTQLIQIK
jgi:CubicO group peptidase (beta-lactamase class C family)